MQFLMDNLTVILSLAGTGVFAGILAGMLGVGGGIVIVPVLFFLFQALVHGPLLLNIYNGIFHFAIL